MTHEAGGFGGLLRGVLENSTTKSVGLSVLMAIAGYMFHAYGQLNQQELQIADNQQQIKELQLNQDTTKVAIDNVAISITRIEGKLDVLNQKIDDDRRNATRSALADRYSVR